MKRSKDKRARRGRTVPASTRTKRPSALESALAEKALSESRLRAVINAEPACVKLVSQEGRLLDMNPAGLAMIGAKDRSQVLGQSIITLVHPDDRSRFIDVHNSAYGGVPASGEYRIFGLSGGGERWVESHAVPFDIAAGVRAVLSVTSDITERKRLEEQLRQSQKMEAVGRLAGGIAHDFNNLLTVIGGYTETALAELPTDAPTAALLREVRRAAESAASLTRRLLMFSRRQIVRLTPLDLNAVVADVEQLLKRTLGEDIEIVAKLPANLRAIQGDDTQIQQVLMNLAVNARDAMPRGGTLTIETANVARRSSSGASSSSGAGSGLVELRVTDTGCGMNEATKARIFEPFFTTKELGRGAGLGLATVYAIVQGMGGAIHVSSDPGRGTTFIIQFPESAVPVEIEAPSVPAPPADLHGTETIMVVEDDDTVRTLTADVLKNAGYVVLEASGPAAALEMAEGGTSAIHLLLSDVIMPGFDGVELSKRFHKSHPHTPVLFMSGYSDDTMARHGLTVDQYELLSKPFSTINLLRKVREALGEQTH
ncbi:MAG TPA: ATP-binding protein [Vicinamibacterales bacterium]|nr:ATP-binding protein [Vicinamibacterales bacterium]